MNKKHVEKFITYLAATLTCVSACAAVLVGNPASLISGTEVTEIVQNADIPKNDKGNEDNDDPGISPQNDKKDEKIKEDENRL